MKTNSFKIIAAVCVLIAFSMEAKSQTRGIYKKPAYQTEQEKSLRNPIKNETLFKKASNKKVPDNIVLPGEFEESQAVAISWSFDYDASGNPSGIDLTSVYADVSAQLADAIQKECTVWIRVLKNSDTALVLADMIKRGTPLTNYRFMATNGDDWWTRDYGPMAFYSKNLDSIGFVDMKYYDGRDYDNLFPSQLATVMGYENYVTQLNAEGGNLMGDGFGRLFFSDVIRNTNGDNRIHSTPWSTNQTYDTLKQIFNTPLLTDLAALGCDGGTGHIDLYVKLIDEQSLIVSQYPKEITAKDRQTIEDNYQFLSELLSPYGRPYRIIRVEHPTDDNGLHTKKSCAQLNNDARNFINGLTVNGSFIFPSYYDGISGNAEQHRNIMAFYKKTFPGYKIVPIDSRELSPLGGAIHCITMQIPAENPIRFWHPSVDGIVLPLNKYHLISKIDNKSGIGEANCYWKKNNDSTWNKVALADSNGYWVGDILNANLQGDDSLYYYLEAKSNNGKTATKPLNAKNGGYYQMKLKYVTGEENLVVESKNHLFSAYPNPAKDYVNIHYKLIDNNKVRIQITDVNGKQALKQELGEQGAGLHTTKIDISDLSNGVYIYQLWLNEIPVMGKKLLIEN